MIRRRISVAFSLHIKHIVMYFMNTYSCIICILLYRKYVFIYICIYIYTCKQFIADVILFLKSVQVNKWKIKFFMVMFVRVMRLKRLMHFRCRHNTTQYKVIIINILNFIN